jgi:hypothetical protein
MPRFIGRYELLDEIGRGGFGHVYRGLDPTVGRPVAIKTLASDGDAGMLTRFRNEATASGRLRHPNIVTIYDFGEHDNVPYIVMELLEGQDLQHVIEGTASVSPLNKVRIMTQIAAGLQHAHSHGVIHRDVKPANVMVLPDGSVKIMDFGIALITQATESRLTPRGAMIGTFRYMAPEQFRNAQTDARSDIFAYGLIFYELLTGVHPFHAADAGALMYNILSVEPVPIGELVPDCPKELQAVIGKLLLKDPDARYQNLDDVLFDIEPALGELRRKRAQELFNEAQMAKSAQRFDTAQELVRQILELAPGDEGARRLREGIQIELRRQAIRPKVDALIKKGQEAMAAGKPADAVEKFESAIRLADVPEVITLLQQARAGVERSREAARLVSEAENAYKSGDAAGAAGLARQALELAPADVEAKRLLTEAEATVAEEKRRAGLAEDLARAQRLIDIRSWDEAAALIAKIDRESPGSFEAAVLAEKRRAGLAKEERERLLESGSAAARQQVQQGDLTGALGTLEKLAAQYPESSDVEKMLGFVRLELETKTRRDFVGKSVDDAKAAAAQREFDRAVNLLDAALARYPGDPDLQRERRSIAAEQREAARRAAAENAISTANSLRSQGRFPEALPALDSFLAAHGDDTAIGNLRSLILKEQETARRAAELHEFVHRARGLMSDGRAEDATALLKAPPSHLKDHPEVTQLLSVAQLQLQERAERKAALEKVLAAVGQLSQKESFDEALSALDVFQKNYGKDAQVDEARSGLTQAKRKKAAKDLLAQGTALLSRDPAGATALFSAAPADIRQEPEIQNLERAALRAIEEQKARKAAVEKAIFTAAGLRSQERLSDALRVLDDFLAAQGADTAIRALREEILKEQEAQAQLRIRQQAERAKAIQDLLSQATTKLESDPAGAAALLGSAPDDLRREPEIQSLEQAALRAVRDQKARGEASERAISAATGLRSQGKFSDALQSLEGFLAAHGADPAIAELREAILQEQEAAVQLKKRQQAERAKAAKELVTRATAMLANDPAGVTALLGSAPDYLREQSEIQSIEQAALRAIEEKKAREAESRLIQETHELCAKGDFASVLSKIDAATIQFPGKFTAIRQEVVAAKEKHDRARLRQETIDKIQAFISNDRYEEAARALTPLLGNAPTDGQLLQLRTEIETRKTAWLAERKEQNIREGLGRAKDALARTPEEAVRLLEALQRDYSDREDVAASLRDAQAAVARKRRQDLLQEVERLAKLGDFEGALARLDATTRDDELIRLREHLKSQQRQALDQRAAEAIRAASNLSKQDPKRALEDLRSLPEPLRSRPEIQAAIQECERVITKAERQAAIASIEDLITRGKFRQARPAQQEAVTRFGADPQFDNLLAAIEAGLQRSPAPVWMKPVPVAAGLGTAAILMIGVWIYGHRSTAPVATLIPVEIRTDPMGASVSLGDRSCQTPNCKFDLPPGSYPVRTQLEGYQPKEQTLTVGSEKRVYSFNLALAPEAAPAPAPGRPTGTLAVQAKTPDALVFADNKPLGRTDSEGKFSSSLEATSHTIRVEKAGYETPREQSVRIVANQSQTKVFNLVPQSAKVELRGAPAGVEIRANGILLGRTDGSGSFSAPVPPGVQTVRLTEGSANREVPQSFDPGQTVSLEWSNVAPAKAPVAAAPKADPAGQEWELARTTSDPAQIQTYIDKYPNGPHAAEAQGRVENLVWTRTNPNDPQSLRAYLVRFPRGPHVRDATARIAELAWNGIDKKDAQGLRTFLDQYPDSVHKPEAQSLIDQLEKLRSEAERLAAERAKQNAQLQLQAKGILSAIDQFNAAFEKKRPRDLRAVWPDSPKEYLDMNQSTASFVLTLAPTGNPVVAGESAAVTCDLTTRTTVRGKANPPTTNLVKVTLKNTGDRWLILDVRKAN